MYCVILNEKEFLKKVRNLNKQFVMYKYCKAYKTMQNSVLKCMDLRLTEYAYEQGNIPNIWSNFSVLTYGGRTSILGYNFERGCFELVWSYWGDCDVNLFYSIMSVIFDEAI